MMHKSVPITAVTIKDIELGEVEVVFATFDVVDLDGDLTVASAISDGAKCAISSFGHQSWGGELPVGLGTIHAEGNEAIFKGRFFLNTPHGRAHFDTIKELADEGLGEWSYGLMNVKSERITVDGKSVRKIKSVDIPEVSPVLVGAGINTRTLSTKSHRKQLDSDICDQLRDLGSARWGDAMHWVYPEDYDVDEGYVVYSIYADDGGDRLVQVDFTRDGDIISLGDTETEVERDLVYSPKSGRRFVEHAKSVLTGLRALVTRAEGIATKRLEDGKSKPLGDESAALLTEADALLVRLKAIDTTNPQDLADDGAYEYARFVAITQGVI